MGDDRHEPSGPALTARRGFFWVGDGPVTVGELTVASAHMYVEWLAPEQVTRPHPVVLVHGGGGQGTDWLATPDGRPGWAPMLVELGFTVYVVDRVGHGRSPYIEDRLGPPGPPAPYEVLRDVFDGPPGSPLAAGHTQWPGTWEPGDPGTDAFMAGTGPMRADAAAAQELDGSRLAQLLRRVGPAVVVTNSAGGPAGWVAAQLEPGEVAMLVAIEPVGPDDAPPRALGNLAQVPAIIVGAEHSIMGGEAAAAVAASLRRLGCDAEHVRLEDHGLHGNGHGMMLERNNREVLDVIVGLLAARGVA